jgi:hypothetical protein
VSVPNPKLTSFKVAVNDVIPVVEKLMEKDSELPPIEIEALPEVEPVHA